MCIWITCESYENIESDLENFHNEAWNSAFLTNPQELFDTAGPQNTLWVAGFQEGTIPQLCDWDLLDYLRECFALSCLIFSTFLSLETPRLSIKRQLQSEDLGLSVVKRGPCIFIFVIASLF